MTLPAAATVWLLDSRTVAPAALTASAAWLGASERQRLAAFVRAERRAQFVAGRALLRLALAPLLGVVPADIPLLERRGAAPLLDLPSPGLPGFSLSHSGPWIACVASASAAVGLDIECLDPARDFVALAAHAFDAAQQATLAALAPAQQGPYFYRTWSTLEARCKLGAPVLHEAILDHPALAIVICCAQRLDQAPRLLDGAALFPTIGAGGNR